MKRKTKKGLVSLLALCIIVIIVLQVAVVVDWKDLKAQWSGNKSASKQSISENQVVELQAQLDYYREQLAMLEYLSEQYFLAWMNSSDRVTELRNQIIQLQNDIKQMQPFVIMPVSFAVDSWALISVLSKNGLASEYYNLGDEKDIVLKTGELITVQIWGFDHDIVNPGDWEMLFDDEGNELGWSTLPSQMAGITLGMKDLLATSYKMESTNTNANGWMGSLMRNDTMQTLFTQLPTDLQAVIQPVLKTTSVGGAQSGILDMAYDSLWLFSEEEIYGQTVFGTNGTSNTANGDKSGNGEEGKQYEYWQQKNGALYNIANSTNRIKKLANGTGAPSIWWLRSPYALIASNFCIVSDTGFATNAVPNTARGICFGFAV